MLVSVDTALAQAKPTIWNSDQGSQFTSPHYQTSITTPAGSRGADQYGWQGRALDNIFTERLWRTPCVSIISETSPTPKLV